MQRLGLTCCAALAGLLAPDRVVRADSGDDKLATYAIDDPLVDGVACYYTVSEKGGIKGTLGLAASW